MKKNRTIFFVVSTIALCLYFSSCSKKNDPSPSDDSNNDSHISGSTDGTVTVNGATKKVSGYSTNSSFGFAMTPRNMTPANSYPAVDVSFNKIPKKDSTYNLANLSTIVSVSTAYSSDSTFYATGGSLVVKVSSTTITATFNSLTAKNTGNTATKTISGKINYYF